VIFPVLEKYGVTQPPKIMWMEHDNIRAIEKSMYETADALAKGITKELSHTLQTQAIRLSETLADHFYKENNILFPTSYKFFNDDDWKLVKQEFDGIGYMSYSPVTQKEKIESAAARLAADTIEFETGNLTLQQLSCMLDTMPVDFTFIDKDDVVRYFNNAPDRIFVRSKAVIGRTVQNCHPDKSIHVVNRLLDEMKAGKRDKAEFWITLGEKFVYITYFAVRNKSGEYLGCLEVTQDISLIKKIEGQKRLLD
jgi:PAS domain S-box-containing protein